MTHMDRSVLVPALTNIATRLRIDSVLATSASGTGHPTSCASAAELMAALFFAELRYDPADPQHPGADRFVLSKGHCVPGLYATLSHLGYFPREDLSSLRVLGSVGDVPLRMVSQAASRRNITFVIREGDLSQALGRVHDAFFAPVSVG